MQLPNLAKVATADLVETIAAGNFNAAYINWSRTVQMLRDHAPGWMPETVQAGDGGLLHRAPVGAYLLIRFRHVDGLVTPEVPQAVMDSRNGAIAWDKITARDITDTQRRGVCMAAAFTFGLAYELWAKLPLESGYAPESTINATPTSGAWDGVSDKQREQIEGIAAIVGEYMDTSDAAGAHEYIASQHLVNEHKISLWTLLDSKTRAALKKAASAAQEVTHE